MKVSLAAHPDWPSAMSNVPDVSPEERRGGLDRPIAPATDRHDRGKAHLSHVLNYWMGRGDLTQRQLSYIANWGLDEPGWLHDTKLTFLRRNQFSRALPIRYLDALGAANQAIWLWQTKAESEAIIKLGPPLKDKVKTEWLDRGFWLPVPDYPDEALGPADFFEIACGYLELPYVAAPILAPNEGPQLTEELCQLLFTLVEGKTMREQLRQILQHYPASDKDRRDKLGSVLLGATTYGREELEAEFYALSEIVRNLRGVSARNYGPCELYAELTAERKQRGGSRDDQ